MRPHAPSEPSPQVSGIGERPFSLTGKPLSLRDVHESQQAPAHHKERNDGEYRAATGTGEGEGAGEDGGAEDARRSFRKRRKTRPSGGAKSC